jgi:hypothetical protein
MGDDVMVDGLGHACDMNGKELKRGFRLAVVV